MADRLIFTFEVEGVRWDETAELVHGSVVEIWNEATEEWDLKNIGELLALPSFRVLRLQSAV